MTAMLLPGNCGDSMNREAEVLRMQSCLQTTILNSSRDLKKNGFGTNED